MNELEIIMNLQRKTINNEIAWDFETRIPRVISVDNNLYVLNCYSFEDHKGHVYYLYRYKERRYSHDTDDYYSYEDVSLVILRDGFILYQINDSRDIYDLYSIVESRVAIRLL